VVQGGAEFRDRYFRQRPESGADLDWAGPWTAPFLGPLRDAGVRTVLELGCGTGNDAARLAAEGYTVTATDLSREAIGRARARFGSLARFLVADMHMFPDSVTRSAVAEVTRLVRAGGLFLFHVNSLQDPPLRALGLPARELEPDYVTEASGQTVHFFSEEHLRELLAGWQRVDLEPVPVPHRQTGEPVRHVWRGIARR
jgi:SAM-dependent methyltransferase